MAINCPDVKQHIANGVNYHDFVQKDAKTLLAEHLRALMSTHQRLKDRAAVAKAAGISPRSVGYMLQPGTGNPTLAHLEAVASAFNLRAWELLIDRDREKQRLMEKVFAPSDALAAQQAGDSPPQIHQTKRTYGN